LFCIIIAENIMKDKIEKLDVVAILEDLPELGISRGDIATVLEEVSEKIFLLEISDRNGKTISMIELPQKSIMKLNYTMEYA